MAPSSNVTYRPRSKRAATPPPLTIKLDKEDPKAKLGSSIPTENQENVTANILQTESSPKDVKPGQVKQDPVSVSPPLQPTISRRSWLSTLFCMGVFILIGAVLCAVFLNTTDESTSMFRERAVMWLKTQFPNFPVEEVMVRAQQSSNVLYSKIAHIFPGDSHIWTDVRDSHFWTDARDWIHEMHRRMIYRQ